MKTLFTSLLAIVCLSVYSQEKYKLPLTPDSLIEYKGVVTLDSTYKYNGIYKAAKTWFVNSFHNSKAVIQSEDQTNGRFLAKGFVVMHQKGFTIVNDPQIWFYLQIDVKDGKYRYRFYNITQFTYLINDWVKVSFSDEYKDFLEDKLKHGLMGKKSFIEKWNYMYADVDSEINGLIVNLKKEVINDKSDDF